MITRLSRFIFFKLMGWKIEGVFPDLNKMIVAVVPHTKNFDFIVGILTRAAINEKINYVGKKELFNPITGWFFKALGGAPINRGAKENTVQAIVKIFKSRSFFRLAIAPEGTRKTVKQWKTGFYYIAREANVPILLVKFDYPQKKVSFLELFYPTDEKKKDFEFMQASFLA